MSVSFVARDVRLPSLPEDRGDRATAPCPRVRVSAAGDDARVDCFVGAALPGARAQRVHSMATNSSQLLLRQAPASEGMELVISSRSTLRNEIAWANSREWQ
jgi:hypothetical protein